MNFNALFLIPLLLAASVNAKNEDRKEEDPPKTPISIRKMINDFDQTCTPGTIDMMLVVDGSGSIGRGNFETVKSFLKGLVTGLNIATTHSRVGLVQFTTDAVLEFNLNQYSTAATVNSAIEGIRYLAGGTYIAGGMDKATHEGFTPATGDRDTITNVMIVLTDGQDGAIQDVKLAYNQASAKGITVLAIGVGHNVDNSELLAATGGNTARVFDVSSFQNLSLITGQICKDVQDLDPCTPDPCKGHGSCTSGNTTQEYTCACAAGYHGNSCENSVCQHNGVFSCACPFGWTGPTCGQVIDWCNNTFILRDGGQTVVPFCGLHGVCVNNPDGASCQCDPDWTGTWCGTNINDCNSTSCLNNGTCIDGHTEPGFTCQCTPLFTGPHCATPVNDCTQLKVLDNGTIAQVHMCGPHGNCIYSPTGGSFCVCLNNKFAHYTGEFCQIETPNSCTWKNHTYPHNSTWVEKCDSCSCLFGQIECADAYWCPQRCVLYDTPANTQHITTTCPPNMNCIPEQFQCTKPNCTMPLGWCFPVGMILTQNITFPTNPPNGYKSG